MAKGEHSAACEGSMTHFHYRQLFVTPNEVSPNKVDLSGQIGIVTGANVGIGLEACRQLLGLGLSRLILAVRSESKGNSAKADLAKSAPGAKIEVWPLDMSSYDSIVSFAERCRSLDRLDFAILNAGVFKLEYDANTTTGQEETVQVNYLSTVLLAILLLPVLQLQKRLPSRPVTRISIVNSEAASWSKFKEQKAPHILTALADKANFDIQDRYPASKLLGQLFLVELIARYPRISTVATINLVNPGMCYGSALHREAGGLLGSVLNGYKRMIGRTVGVGARTLVDAAVAKGPESHGRYMGDCVLKPFAPFVTKPEGKTAAKKLFDETMTELEFAGVKNILEMMK